MLSPTPPHSPSPGAAPSSAPMRRLAAVWFADLVGYTALSARDEAAALRLVALFQGLSRTLVGEHGGRIVKFVGDAVLAEFGSAEAAVQSALALDASLRDASHEAGLPASLRTGVHLGELTFAPDGDVYGDGVNVAARLQTEAAIGRVLVSEDVWRQLRGRRDFRFSSLGELELRGISARVAVFDVAHEGGAPPPEISAKLARPTASTRPKGAALGRPLLWSALAVALAVAGAVALRPEWLTRLRAGPPPLLANGQAFVAVMTFKGTDTDARHAEFASALTEAVQAELGSSSDLLIATPAVASRFEARSDPVRALAREVGVTTVLQGTTRWSGTRVRVLASLLDAASGRTLWTQSFERDVANDFEAQRALALDIAAW